jgi:hypothetical protein
LVISEGNSEPIGRVERIYKPQTKGGKSCIVHSEVKTEYYLHEDSMKKLESGDRFIFVRISDWSEFLDKVGNRGQTTNRNCG